jgi:hypothetical protein
MLNPLLVQDGHMRFPWQALHQTRVPFHSSIHHLSKSEDRILEVVFSGFLAIVLEGIFPVPLVPFALAIAKLWVGFVFYPSQLVFSIHL